LAIFELPIYHYLLIYHDRACITLRLLGSKRETRKENHYHINFGQISRLSLSLSSTLPRKILQIKKKKGQYAKSQHHPPSRKRALIVTKLPSSHGTEVSRLFRRSHVFNAAQPMMEAGKVFSKLSLAIKS
jgi:hypothetical protein